MARERYLHNAGEDTIHDHEIQLVTAKDKRANWWFYHKFHLLAAIVGAIILGTMVYSVVTKVNPDYTIGLITSYGMPQNGITQLEECFEQFADDRNGDGKVAVDVVNYVFSEDADADYQQTQASLVHFTADCATNTVIIYLHDEEGLKLMQGNMAGILQYNDGTPMPMEARDYENATVAWGDFAGLASFEPQSGEDDLYDASILTQLYGQLGVSLRVAEGSSIEYSEKATAYYQDCLALYQRMKNGEVINPAAGEEG